MCRQQPELDVAGFVLESQLHPPSLRESKVRLLLHKKNLFFLAVSHLFRLPFYIISIYFSQVSLAASNGRASTGRGLLPKGKTSTGLLFHFEIDPTILFKLKLRL